MRDVSHACERAPSKSPRYTLIAGGHLTETPNALTYSSVASRESVRITFTLAALNNLNILTADSRNAYLNAPYTEKVHIKCGLEFSPDKISIMDIIVRALYGLKSAGVAWHTHLKQTIHEIGFKPCLADGDVYLSANTKHKKVEYYEYLMVHVDVILAISIHQNFFSCLEEGCIFKNSSIKKPDQYLFACGPLF